MKKAPPKASPGDPAAYDARGVRLRDEPGRARGTLAPAPPHPAGRLQAVDRQDAPGGRRQAEADDLLSDLEQRLGDVLRPGDLETGPTGEVRWRTAARTARKQLADDGLLLAPRPGTWALTDRGSVEWVPDLPSA